MIVDKFRSQFAALNIAKNANPEIFIKCSDADLKGVLEKEADVFNSLIRSGSTTVLSATANDPDGCLKSYLNEQLTIYVKVVGVIDTKLEVERVQKRNKALDDLIQKMQKKMDMKDYDTKVPENVKRDNESKLKAYQDEYAANQKSIQDLSKLQWVSIQNWTDIKISFYN